MTGCDHEGACGPSRWPIRLVSVSDRPEQLQRHLHTSLSRASLAHVGRCSWNAGSCMSGAKARQGLRRRWTPFPQPLCDCPPLGRPKLAVASTPSHPSHPTSTSTSHSESSRPARVYIPHPTCTSRQVPTISNHPAAGIWLSTITSAARSTRRVARPTAS